MQLEVKLHKLIVLAYQKGYRITEEGKLNGIKGERKITIPPSGQYPRFTFRCGYEYSKGGSYGIPVHMFAAYCFYGNDIFKEGIEVRHLNANISDVSKKNIGLGTRQENENDKPKEIREKVGRINSLKRKGKRPSNARFTIEEVKIIKRRIKDGESNADIARDYSVSRNTIRDIRNERTYVDVKFN